MSWENVTIAGGKSPLLAQEGGGGLEMGRASSQEDCSPGGVEGLATGERSSGRWQKPEASTCEPAEESVEESAQKQEGTLLTALEGAGG